MDNYTGIMQASASIDALVDMDNVITDFTSEYEAMLLKLLPPEAFVTQKRNLYYYEERFEAIYHAKVEEILCAQGFFANLRPIDGAIEAIYQMIKEGLSVKLCTTPHATSSYCYD